MLNVTEPVIRYMLATYFALQPERALIPPYEENEKFNEALDEANDLPGKLSYSRALYDQYPEDYVIQLKEYNDELEAMRADLDAILDEGDASGDAE